MALPARLDSYADWNELEYSSKNLEATISYVSNKLLHLVSLRSS